MLYFRPVLIELPHIASLHDDEREVIALRSNDGISWHEHPVTASEIVGSLLKFAGESSHLNYYCIKSNFHSKLIVVICKLVLYTSLHRKIGTFTFSVTRFTTLL